MINRLIDDLLVAQNDFDERLATLHKLIVLAMTSTDVNMVKGCRDQIAEAIRALNVTAGQMHEIGQEIQSRKAETGMRTWTLIGMLIIGLLLGVLPAAAQEATQGAVPSQIVMTGVPVGTLVAPLPPHPEQTEQPPVDDDISSPTFWIFTAIIVGGLAMLVLVLRPLIMKLGESAPAWAVEASYAAIVRMLEQAQAQAGKTASTIDDALVAELRAEIERLKEQIMVGRGATQTSSVGALTSPKPPYSDVGAPGEPERSSS